MARECPNRQKKKEKVLAATWDDSDSEKKPNCDESDSDDENFIAFTASLCSHDSYDKAADEKIENESDDDIELDPCMMAMLVKNFKKFLKTDNKNTFKIIKKNGNKGSKFFSNNNFFFKQ